MLLLRCCCCLLWRHESWSNCCPPIDRGRWALRLRKPTQNIAPLLATTTRGPIQGLHEGGGGVGTVEGFHQPPVPKPPRFTAPCFPSELDMRNVSQLQSAGTHGGVRNRVQEQEEKKGLGETELRSEPSRGSDRNQGRIHPSVQELITFAPSWPGERRSNRGESRQGRGRGNRSNKRSNAHLLCVCMCVAFPFCFGTLSLSPQPPDPSSTTTTPPKNTETVLRLSLQDVNGQSIRSISAPPRAPAVHRHRPRCGASEAPGTSHRVRVGSAC